ncbi:MAG: site-2 protease family protein, partial [Elusimicrobia bacterium]|nr:site-2 protease family protein [Elusimicrobiota bacterium]
MEWIYQAPILFFSVVFHEFAHGYTAHRHGDDTALIMGRLTLNPLPHIDFMGTILLPVLCALGNMPIFGWAKPVPINPNRLLEPAKDIFKVAVAGPSANFLLALIFAVIFKMSAILLPVVGGGFALIALKAAFFGGLRPCWQTAYVQTSTLALCRQFVPDALISPFGGADLGQFKT